MSKTADRPSVLRGFVLALLLLALSGGQALAHRSPSNCNANRLTFALDRNSGDIVNGQTVTYAVGVFNPGPGIGIGCDVTGLTVTFTCPGPDGTPSGPTTVLGTSLSFPADNSSDTIFPLVSCKIIVNPGVTSATARGQVGQNTGNRTADLLRGVVHDSAIDDPFVQINDLTVSVNITCAAKVDKQVSCDGGKTFHDVGLVTADEDGHTDVCFGWNAFTIGSTSMPAEPIQVRYAVANAGTAELFTCSITEGNAGFPTTVSVGSLAGACGVDVDCANPQATCVNGACVVTSGVSSAACSATLSAAEPDTATVTCDCTPTPGEVQATAFDQAKFQCLTPGLAVTKECKTQAAGTNEVDITLMNTGTADLQNCVVTDKVFPNDATCPPTTTTSTDVTVAGVTSLPAGQSATVMGSVTGLTTNACNTVSVTCGIKDSVDPSNPSQPKKTPPATDQDVCAAAPPKNCFTRTPGFWGTHPHITQRVLGTGLPSCGLVVNTTAAATPVSSTEDICSVGTDSGANHTSPQQVQLIRQCMSAALNLAATAHAPQPGDCNSVFPGITQMFNTCCTGPTSVCDSGASPGAIDASGCIGTLDRFNNLETTFDIGVGQGPAKPADCHASKNNGFLNPGRNLGPARY